MPELRAIVKRMMDAGESEDNIAAVIRRLSSAPEPPTPVAPSGMAVFAQRAAERLNPVAMAQGFGRMVIPEAAARALGADDAEASQYGPVNALKHMGQATQGVFEEAKRAYDAGDYGNAAIKAFFGAIPLVGPDLNQMGNAMAEGRTAEALGDATGLGLSLVAPQVAKAGTQAVRSAAKPLAASADAKATANTVDAMVPKIGPNKRRYGAMAEKVAPRVIRETSAVTPSGLLEQVGTRLDDASAALDAAYDAVPTNRMYATQPIKDALQLQIRNLSVSGVEPATRASRLASLKQAIAEVDQLGGVTNLQNLRNLKASWAEGGKAIYTPDIAADALKVRGAGHGWADAASAVGDYLTTRHPELKALNSDVSLWIKAQDVLKAAEDVERVRPTVGRSIMARGLGAAAGGAGAGVPGAITGAVVGPLVEKAIANASPTMKLTIARQMARVADALRSGNQAQAQSLFTVLQKMVPAGGALHGVSELSVAAPKAAEATERSPR